MSSVFVHVGQAGNQIGQHIWQRHADYAQQKHQQAPDVPLPIYTPNFTADCKARALLVDSEPKVVRTVYQAVNMKRMRIAKKSATGENGENGENEQQNAPLTQRDRFGKPVAAPPATAAAAGADATYSAVNQSLFRPANIVYEQSGRGNNWALGYSLDAAYKHRVGDDYQQTVSAPKPAKGSLNRPKTASSKSNGSKLGSNATLSSKTKGTASQADANSDGSVSTLARTKSGAATIRIDRGVRKHYGSTISEHTLDVLRREMERCENGCDGLVLVSSTSGGTGSGVGSRLIECIREEHSKIPLLSALVLPFTTGETPLQHYNTLFTVSHHYQYADAVLQFHNNDILHIVQQATSRYTTVNSSAANNSSIQSVSFDAMNRYITDCMVDILAPINIQSQKQVYNPKQPNKALPVQAQSLTDLISHLCPVASCKLLEAYTTGGLTELADSLVEQSRPQSALHRKQKSSLSAFNSSTMGWLGLIDQLAGVVPRYTHTAVANRPATFSYSIYARGDYDNSLSGDAAVRAKLDTRMQKLFPTVAYNKEPVQTHITSLAPYSASSYQNPSLRSLAVCINRARSASGLSSLVNRARTMEQSGAYVHWYTRYGISRQRFGQAFDQVEDIIESYREMVK